MRLFAILLGVLAASPAVAGDFLDGYVAESKALAFLTKSRPCYFWMAFAPNDRRVGPEAAMPTTVLCFMNGVLEEGTVNEARGCVMAHYRLDLNSYTAPTKTGKFYSEAGACSVEKVRALMGRLPSGVQGPAEVNATMWAAAISHLWDDQSLRFGGTGPSQAIGSSVVKITCAGDERRLQSALKCSPQSRPASKDTTVQSDVPSRESEPAEPATRTGRPAWKTRMNELTTDSK